MPDGSGNPLNKTPSFLDCKCPKCGKAAKRETDTMDTFVDSSWYFIRYACPDQAAAMVDERAKYWMPVDQYIGGIEHAILHLLYSRFWTKVMRDLGLITGVDEPFTRLLTQGMVLNEIFFRKSDEGRIVYFNPADVELKLDEKGQRIGAVLRSDSQSVESAGMGTMSKQKNNGVDPKAIIDEYGADTARLFMMFASPPEDSLVWSDDAIEGASRFLRRLWRAVHEHVSEGIVPAFSGGTLTPELRALRFAQHSTIAKVTDDYGRRQQYNTVIAAVMEFMNSLARLTEMSPLARSVRQEALESVVLLLSPIVPHICNALWSELRPGADVMREPWPEIDEAALQQDDVELVLQVNGKLRGHMRVPKSTGREHLEQLALTHESVTRHTQGQVVKKVVVVPGRLVNVVV